MSVRSTRDGFAAAPGGSVLDSTPRPCCGEDGVRISYVIEILAGRIARELTRRCPGPHKRNPDRRSTSEPRDDASKRCTRRGFDAGQ